MKVQFVVKLRYSSNVKKTKFYCTIRIEFIFSVASTEDSPIANKLKRIWFKTPIGEEQATQAVLDPVVGKSLNN